MFQAEYFVDKSSNTLADNLAAFGLAFVLNALANPPGEPKRAKIRLEDRGFAFVVVCDPPLRPEWVEEREFFIGAPFLVTWDRKSAQKVVKGTTVTLADIEGRGSETVVDYEAEKQRNQAYFDWLRSLSTDDKKRAMRGELQGADTPRSDWDVFRAINPGALQAYNSLMAAWWQGRAAFPELLKALLQMTATTPNDDTGAEAAWNKVCKARGLEKPKAATASQLFNPAQGKGTNYPKAEWRAPGNLKGFWLWEWLKAVGLFHGGFTRIVANPSDPRNAKDRKTYVLCPLHLEWGVHQAVLNHFRPAMVGSATAIKLDILATLRYTEAFLKHYEETRETDLFGRRPSDLVSGMQTAFYKSLGQSPAVLNIATLNLPRWVNPHGPDELAAFAEALDEHLRIIRSLDETRGDQFTLLAHYRDFLSGDDFTPFFAFTTAYSGFVMQQYDRRKYVRPFTTTTLEVLFMNSDKPVFSEIVQNEGFKAIAYAIRHSTVVPQARKGKGNKPIVDIRYGLGQQLARKAAYPADFLAEIAEFIHLYNAENAQLREKGRNPFRKNVTTADIEALTALVDQFGSKVVCQMLVAYGYAREPYEEKEDGDEGDQNEPLISDADADEGDGENED
ncbi:MAG: hypothetical protein WHX52_02700 [Anaerolineae bacterium]